MKPWDSLISSLISNRKGTEIYSRCLYCIKLCNLRLTLRRNRNFAILFFQLGKYFFIVGKVNNISYKEFCPYPQLPPRLPLLSFLSSVRDLCNQGRNGNAWMSHQYRYTHYHHSQPTLWQTPSFLVLYQQTSWKKCCMMPSG